MCTPSSSLHLNRHTHAYTASATAESLNYISRESKTTRNVLWSRASVCLSAAACPHYCTDPDVIGGAVGDAPSCALLGGFAIGARVALLWQHYGNAWQSPAVIRQANRTPHACRTRTLRMPAKTPLAGDNIDAPAAYAVPFYPHCGGVTRTRNVSEYMFVLALCLVWC